MTSESRSSALAVDAPDVQARRPATRISLSRVGVTGVEKIIRISANGSEQLYHAALECYVDLNPEQTGVHMSRFQEVVNEAIDEVVLGEAFKAETLASHIAERVRERQGGLRSEVTIRARYPEHKRTPATGRETQELYTLSGTAVASERGVRRLVGVEAQGMTACPCAQELVTEASRERLVEQGFTDDEIERVFESVPVATHNQRGIGVLCVGCPEGYDIDLRAEKLLRVVEESMSSEIFELMKRPDERLVVEKAHNRPRFVEDCVRAMIRGLVITYPELDENAFVLARQENLETIHQHSVVAERNGLLGEIRNELDSEQHSRHPVTMREWLESPGI
jgi:GTP cyclohydrolase IV